MKSHFFDTLSNHLVGSVLSAPPDAGAGSGGASSTAAGAGAGAGGQNTGVVAGAGAGGGTPLHLADDAMVHFGDATKPVKWGEHKKTLMSRQEYDNGMSSLQKGRDYLIGEAAKLEAAYKKFDAGRGPKPAEPRPGDTGQDDFDQLEEMAVVDGRTMAKTLKSLRDNGMGSIAKLVTSLQAKVAKLEGDFQGVGKIAGNLDEQHRSTQFDGYVTKTLGEIGEIKGLPNGHKIDPANPVFREIAQDIYLSHDQQDPSLAREFPRLLKERIEGFVALVRAADKKALDTANQPGTRKFFSADEGRATPNGDRPYVHRTGDALARELFATS